MASRYEEHRLTSGGVVLSQSSSSGSGREAEEKVEKTRHSISFRSDATKPTREVETAKTVFETLYEKNMDMVRREEGA
jgi:hypothetical protein